MRVFKSRSSEGVNGMDLAEGDRGDLDVGASTTSRSRSRSATSICGSAARRRRQAGENGEGEPRRRRAARPSARALRRAGDGASSSCSPITVNGFGKRTSAYEYRVTNRGGQGIINIETSARNGRVAATFPVAETDQVMLVTDKGQTIRIPVHDIRIAGRNTQGVKLFHTDADEHIVSAARLSEAENGDEPEDVAAEG